MNRPSYINYPTIFFATASLAILYLSGPPVPKPELSFSQLVFLGFYTLLLGYVGVSLPGLGQANLSMMGNLILASLLNPLTAAGVTFLTAPLRLPLRLERELFNRVQLALATLVAAFAYEKWGFFYATLFTSLSTRGQSFSWFGGWGQIQNAFL